MRRPWPPTSARFAAAMLLTPVPVTAQTLLTAQDVVALRAPQPTARIAYGDDAPQFGHLRLPDGAGPHPVVIFLHGGCWLAEYDIAHVGTLEQAIADEGYAVWSLEYRRVGDRGGGWPGTFLDVARGADHLRALATRYPLDLTRLVAAGHSAGGQLALWLAARGSLPDTSELWTADPLPIHGVLGLAPAADLEGLQRAGTCGGAVGRLMGGSPGRRPERYRAASPMQLVPIRAEQAVIVGAHDQTWSPAGRAYVERAREAGDTSVRLVEAPDSGHFELIVPTTTTWRLVRDTLRGLFDTLDR